jgi:hypothetical protein
MFVPTELALTNIEPSEISDGHGRGLGRCLDTIRHQDTFGNEIRQLH